LGSFSSDCNSAHWGPKTLLILFVLSEDILIKKVVAHIVNVRTKISDYRNSKCSILFDFIMFLKTK
jgi:hypothetical protein